MTKDSAAWLIIKAFGVSLMFVAFVEWIDMCSQIAVYLRYVSTEEVLRAHVDSRAAEIMVIALLELVKAAGVTAASVYLCAEERQYTAYCYAKVETAADRGMIVRIAAVSLVKMKMKFSAVLFLVTLCNSAFGAVSISSYSEAEKVWQQTRHRPEYQTYATEFAQFNNHFHVDTKDGCYRLGKEPVQIMLVIIHRDGDEFAKVGNVFTNVANEKAACFTDAYMDISTKAPPFYPFVLQLGMN